ncbi:MAG: acyl-CoA desaturase [Thermoplasmatota archaeon]
MPADPTPPSETGLASYPFHEDSWVSKALTLAFVVLPLAAMGVAIALLWGRLVGPFEVGVFAGMWTLTGFGISLGFHRMLTHRSFAARSPTRAVLLILGTMSMQGPPADWAATHIRHHARADREGDPHSPLEGFWHAHLGWLMRDRFVRNGAAHERLLQDPVVSFVQKTWAIWATLGMVLPGLLGWWLKGGWLGFWDGILWGGLVRVFWGHHVTWSVNSVAHLWGTRPFATTDRARNNALVALFSWGEGWHNNHHAFPRAAYMGLRWWQFDPGKWMIRALRLVGQVQSVRIPTRAERQDKRRRATA